MFKRILGVTIVFLLVFSAVSWAKGENELREEIAKLQAEIQLLKDQNTKIQTMMDQLKEAMKPYIEKAANENRQKVMGKKFHERSDQDLKTYSQKDMDEAEKLYQPANKGYSEDALKNLEKVIGKYPKCNRAGCGALYLGQRLSGDKKVQYLKLAIDKYGDCFYGDGVQVGAYARYTLAQYYKKTGKNDESAKLFEEMKKLYPDAIDHQGRILSETINEDED